MKELYWIAYYVSVFSPLVGVVVYLLNHLSLKAYTQRHALYIVIRKNERVQKDKCLSLILLLFLASFTTDFSSLIYYYTGHQGDVINNTYNLLQFMLLSAFYHHLHEDGAAFRQKKIAWIGIGIYILVVTASLLATRSVQQYLLPPRLTGNIIFIGYALYTFIRLRGGPLVDDRQMSVLAEEMYSTIVKIVSAPVWFNVGVLVYFGGSLIITLIETYIQPQLFSNPVYVAQAYTIWIIHNLLNIIKNILFALGMYYAGKYGMARRLKLPPARYVPFEAN